MALLRVLFGTKEARNKLHLISKYLKPVKFNVSDNKRVFMYSIIGSLEAINIALDDETLRVDRRRSLERVIGMLEFSRDNWRDMYLLEETKRYIPKSIAKFEKRRLFIDKWNKEMLNETHS